jgi:CRISPR-associated protein Cas1
LNEHVDPKWQFSGRSKNPPKDPINAMLSFGYSCLYHHISTALQICGLNPCIGWFHESRENYHALACDLQEEFRFIIDSLVLFLLHRNMVSMDNFIKNDAGRFPCLMTKEFRKAFLQQLEEKLLTEFTPDDCNHAINYRSFFLWQARQIEDICYHPEKAYQPLRIR